MRSAAKTFIEDLVDAFPALKPAFEEHLEYFGGLLPHLFLADTHRFVLRAYAAGQQADTDAVVVPILDYLEDHFRSGSDDVKELVSVSFVELLPRRGEPGFPIRELLGSDLRAEAERVA